MRARVRYAVPIVAPVGDRHSRNSPSGAVWDQAVQISRNSKGRRTADDHPGVTTSVRTSTSATAGVGQTHDDAKGRRGGQKGENLEAGWRSEPGVQDVRRLGWSWTWARHADDARWAKRRATVEWKRACDGRKR